MSVSSGSPDQVVSSIDDRIYHPLQITPNDHIDVERGDQNGQSSVYNVEADSLRWIPTVSPGLQTVHLSPENSLSNVEQLEIQTTMEVLERKYYKQYRVKVKNQLETLFLAVESNAPGWQKTILGSSRRFDFILRDASGRTAFTLTKKSLSCGFIPGFLPSITIGTPLPIGWIEQDFTLSGVSFSVYDAEKRSDGPVCYIFGPSMYCCCCTKKEVHFRVISLDGSVQIGSIMYQWDHLLVDYILLVSFNKHMDVKTKSLILGATFLLQSLYFDR